MASSPVLFKWSEFGQLFPAGGNLWNGQLVALQPPGTWFTPNVPLDAEEVNWCLTSISNNLQYLLSARAADWNPPVAKTTVDASATNLFNAGWDGVNNAWQIALVQTDPFVHCLTSFDGLDTWLTLSNSFSANGTGVQALAVVQDAGLGSTSYVSVVTSGGGFVGVQTFKQTAGTTTAPANGQVAGTFTDVQGIFFSGYHIIALGSVGPTKLVSSNNGWSGAPSTSVTDASQSWLLAASPSICVAAPAYAALATPAVTTTVDGHTWIHQTAGFGGNLSATDQITGIAYGSDANGTCFLMTVLVVGSTGKVLRSSDGINWTLVSTTSSNFISNICCADTNLWIGQIRFSGIALIVTSMDGGVTWRFTGGSIAGTQTIVGVLVGAPTQALIMSKSSVRTCAVFAQGALMT